MAYSNEFMTIDFSKLNRITSMFSLPEVPRWVSLAGAAFVYVLAHLYTMSLVKQFFMLDISYRVMNSPILIMDTIKFSCGCWAWHVLTKMTQNEEGV